MHETIARIGAAWNAGDAAAYAAEFTEDATYVAFNGQVSRGRAEIEAGHRWLFAGPLRGSRMAEPGTGPSWDVRMIRPDVALVLTEGGGIRPDGAAEVPTDRISAVSLVVVDDGGTWRIAAFQNTRRADAGARS